MAVSPKLRRDIVFWGLVAATSFAFNRLDIDESGFISFDNLKSLVEGGLSPIMDEAGKRELVSILQEYDQMQNTAMGDVFCSKLGPQSTLSSPSSPRSGYQCIF